MQSAELLTVNSQSVRAGDVNVADSETDIVQTKNFGNGRGGVDKRLRWFWVDGRTLVSHAFPP